MFELLNVKWGEPVFGTPSGTITWSSDLGGELALANGATDESILSTFQAALSAWESVAAVDFEQVASGADFTVGAAPIDPTYAGVASYGPSLPGLNSLTSASITFNSNYIWSDNGGFGTTDFYAVALHEIGHVLGLDHPDDPTQVMNDVIYVDELGAGDIAGIQFIYGTDDDDPVGAPLVTDSSGGGGGGALGLLLGLLALIAAFFTGGGGGAAVAMAAGRIADRDDDDEPMPSEADLDDLAAIFGLDDCGDDCADGHGVSIAEFALLPAIDFTTQTNPCGCVGLCSHMMDEEEEPQGDVFI